MRKAISHWILCIAAVTPLTAGIGQSQQIQSTEVDSLYAAPADGGVRRWEVASPVGVALLDQPAGTAAKTEPIPHKSIVANFGCSVSNGIVWCNVRPLHGGPMGFVTRSELRLVKGPDGIIARGLNDSDKRAKRKRFDTSSVLRCAQEVGEALGTCQVGVARDDGGDATAAITFANGFTRYLYFMHGQFISASATMSGAGRDTDWRIETGVHHIRVDDQRFEIPHLLLFGSE